MSLEKVLSAFETRRLADPTGELSEEDMAFLMDKFRTEKMYVEHTIKYKLSLDSHRRASVALKKAQKDAGLSEQALEYVKGRRHGKCTEVEIKSVLRQDLKLKASTLHGLHVPELLQKVIDAVGIKPRQTIAQTMQRAAKADTAADATAATAAPCATVLSAVEVAATRAAVTAASALAEVERLEEQAQELADNTAPSEIEGVNVSDDQPAAPTPPEGTRRGARPRQRRRDSAYEYE